MNNATARIEPDASAKPVARQVWRSSLASESERNRFVSQLANIAGAGWQVCWRGDCLALERQIARTPAGAAFGDGTLGQAPAPTLGSSRIVCDGARICVDGELGDAAVDDAAFLSAKVAKLLNWRRVVIHSGELFQTKFRQYALHEADFYTWAIKSAETLRARRPDGIDWESLAEEVEDLGRSETRALKSQLSRLLQHLLKWSHQSSRHDSWRRSIEGSRDEIHELLEDNPGLKSEIPVLMKRAYKSAIRGACDETGLAESAYPEACPWTFDQVTDENFWPTTTQSNGHGRKPAPRTRIGRSRK